LICVSWLPLFVYISYLHVLIYLYHTYDKRDGGWSDKRDGGCSDKRDGGCSVVGE